MPLEMAETLMIVDDIVEQSTNRQDARMAKKNTSHDPWRSLASWRFNSDAFSEGSSHAPLRSG
jgi:hypothetical protein